MGRPAFEPLRHPPYQALYEAKQKDIGVTTCVGIGGDPVPGTSFIDCLEAFEATPNKAVMMIGEIGGSAEGAAEFIKNHMSKPVSSYIAGVTPLPARRWATPAPSCRAGRHRRCEDGSAGGCGVRVGQNPTEPAN